MTVFTIYSSQYMVNTLDLYITHDYYYLKLKTSSTNARYVDAATYTCTENCFPKYSHITFVTTSVGTVFLNTNCVQVKHDLSFTVTEYTVL